MGHLYIVHYELARGSVIGGTTSIPLIESSNGYDWCFVNTPIDIFLFVCFCFL